MSDTDFLPTYLMIKRHCVTGLMYFCKTSTRDPLKYHGSGKYWKDHLRIHGRNIETVWYQLFNNKDDLVEFALFFSEFHNIVKATDVNGNKIWANMIPEDGLQGGQNVGMSGPGVTFYGRTHTSESKKLMGLPGNKNGMYGRKHTADSLEQMRNNRPAQTAEKNPFYGKTHDQQSKCYGSKNGMFGKARSLHHGARKCNTPAGVFNCILDAAEHHSVSDQTIRNRIKSKNAQFEQYFYLKE